MNTETEIKNNAESLHTNLKYTGFEVNLEELKKEMATLKPEFVIEIKKAIGGKLHEGKEMVYTLPLTKSQTENNYFFNSFYATLKRPGMDDISNGFYTDARITSREAFNMLEGSAVEKKYNRHEILEENGKKVYKPIKDDTYLAWRKIDFNDADAKGYLKLQSYGEGYGFDFEKKLSELPLKSPLDENDKRDLKKGELLAVTYEKDGTAIKGYLEANPRVWNFNTLDSDLKRIPDMNKHLNQLHVEKLATVSKTNNVANDLSGKTQAESNKQTNGNKQAAEKPAAAKKVSKGKKKGTGIHH